MNFDDLKNIIRGDVEMSDEALEKYSRDASIFVVRPKVIVFPKDSTDVCLLVKWVNEHKKEDPTLSITPRCAGTCMSGGSINESIILDMSRYMNGIGKITKTDEMSYGHKVTGYATVLPGTFYRDFEKVTLAENLILPSYTASKELCAVGGMVGNNSGGEKSIKFGKTEDWIRELKVVFRDGYEYTVKRMTKKELYQKVAEVSVEAELYKELLQLINDNDMLITSAKPQVSKNSAGYYLWNIYDKETESFDLCRLIVGSQGTLGIVTEITFNLTDVTKESRLLVVFMNDLSRLGHLVDTILPLGPESIESYDDYSLKLAVKFMPDFLKRMSLWQFIKMGISFIPEVFMMATGGVPKLVMIAEFTGNNLDEVERATRNAQKQIASFGFKTRVTKSKADGEKYWRMRRESFNMLRKHVKGKHTAPFIDDVCIKPEFLPVFLPRLNALLAEYKLVYTIAGHAGNGNFHIIPLMDFTDTHTKEVIMELSEKVYDLVREFNGTITAEHNDGLVRTPYLGKIFSPEILNLFKQTKELFDPENIFNPNKKVGTTKEYMSSHIVLEKHDMVHGS
ncbi:MAG: FAD-binding oxidoreductase [bacterium]